MCRVSSDILRPAGRPVSPQRRLRLKVGPAKGESPKELINVNAPDAKKQTEMRDGAAEASAA